MGLGVEAAFPLQGGARQSHLAWGCPWAHTGAPNKASASQGALTQCGSLQGSPLCRCKHQSWREQVPNPKAGQELTNPAGASRGQTVIGSGDRSDVPNPRPDLWHAPGH